MNTIQIPSEMPSETTTTSAGAPLPPALVPPSAHSVPRGTGKLGPPSHSRRRNGRVARLPREIRTRVNQMLDDNLPFRQILQNLGEFRGSITVACIGRWKKGGYQDYLLELARLDETRLRSEFIAELVKADPSIDAYQAANKISAGLICRTVAELGSQSLHDAVKRDPLNFLRLLNSLPRLTASGLQCEKFLAEQAERLAQTRAAAQPAPGKICELPRVSSGESNCQMKTM